MASLVKGVWYVEDNNEVRETLHEVLSKRGFSVQVFPDGNDALEAYKKNLVALLELYSGNVSTQITGDNSPKPGLPRVILTDNRMPRMDGTDLFENILYLIYGGNLDLLNRLYPGRGYPFTIFFSGTPSDIPEKFIKMEGVEVLRKPAKIRYILNTLNMYA